MCTVLYASGVLSGCERGFVQWGFVQWGFVLWGFVSVGFCPVGFCPVGFCPVGFCLYTFLNINIQGQSFLSVFVEGKHIPTNYIKINLCRFEINFHLISCFIELDVEIDRKGAQLRELHVQLETWKARESEQLAKINDDSKELDKMTNKQSLLLKKVTVQKNIV